MELVDLIRIGNLCLAGLAAGGMVMVAVAIIPARSSLPAPRALELWQLTTPRIDKSLAATVGVGALSARFFESRAYRSIATWSPESPPAEQAALFGRWNTMHGVRVVLSVAALAAYATAALAG